MGVTLCEMRGSVRDEFICRGRICQCRDKSGRIMTCMEAHYCAVLVDAPLNSKDKFRAPRAGGRGGVFVVSAG